MRQHTRPDPAGFSWNPAAKPGQSRPVDLEHSR